MMIWSCGDCDKGPKAQERHLYAEDGKRYYSKVHGNPSYLTHKGGRKQSFRSEKRAKADPKCLEYKHTNANESIETKFMDTEEEL